MMALVRTVGYFIWVIIVGSIPIVGPLLAWNMGCNLGRAAERYEMLHGR